MQIQGAVKNAINYVLLLTCLLYLTEASSGPWLKEKAKKDGFKFLLELAESEKDGKEEKHLGTALPPHDQAETRTLARLAIAPRSWPALLSHSLPTARIYLWVCSWRN